MKPINILGALGIVLFFSALFAAIAKVSGLKTAAISFAVGFGGATFIALCVFALLKR